MVQELSYCPSAEAAAPQGVRSLMGQVEAELHRSPTYGQVLADLRELPSDVEQQVKRFVNAIGREAIRLAFRKLVRRSKASQPSVGTAPPLPPPPPPNPQLMTEPMAAAPSRSARLPLPRTPVRPTPQRSLSRKERAAQAVLQAWETRLKEIGQEISQARQAQGRSLYYLHLRTQISLQQLEALEAGNRDRLPEDIYIRGFLRRIGEALEMDTDLADSLPPLDPVKAILPTWQRPSLQTGVHLRPVHLYIGYAALLAGGLTWLSQQTAPKEVVPPQPTQNVTPSQNNSLQPTAAPQIGLLPDRSIAPPEQQPYPQ